MVNCTECERVGVGDGGQRMIDIQINQDSSALISFLALTPPNCESPIILHQKPINDVNIIKFIDFTTIIVQQNRMTFLPQE